MMERSGNVVRSVAWGELLPWLNIFKTFRLAIGFRALVMSALAVLLTAVGWSLFGFGIFSDSCSTDPKPYSKCPWKELTDMVPDRPDILGGSQQNLLGNSGPFRDPDDAKAFLAMVAEQNKAQAPYEPVTGSWSFLSRPLLEGFGLDVTFGKTLRLIGCGLWALAVWAFFGAAITRIAAVQLAANERVTWGASLRYACSKFFAYFFAPLLPIVGIALASIPVLIIGSLLSFKVGAVFVGLFLWPILLIAGLTIALLLVGLIFGWPLMWPTISTEGSDSFDALSRSYAAVYQRPLHYLFYVAVAMALGFLGWIFVKNFAATVVWTTYWAASCGAGAERIREIINMQTDSGVQLTGMAYAAAWLVHFWTGMAKLLAVGFSFSFFWNSFAAIYLLLRRDVDATEMDEVYLDADEGEAKFGLPKIVVDDSGAPEVEEKPKSNPVTSPEVEANQEKAPEAAPPATGSDSEEKPSSP